LNLLTLAEVNLHQLAIDATVNRDRVVRLNVAESREVNWNIALLRRRCRNRNRTSRSGSAASTPTSTAALCLSLFASRLRESPQAERAKNDERKDHDHPDHRFGTGSPLR